MGKFFKSHPEILMYGLAILLSAIIIGSFIWGTADLAIVLNKAISGKGGAPNEKVGFQLGEAKKLDWRGLVQ